MARTKRILTRKTDTEDHFSRLPEPLIVYILSMLDMTYAVNSSPLSKSWINLWTNVDNIVYERSHFLNYSHNWQIASDDDWISFIDRTLPLCKAHIKSFTLSGYSQFPVDLLDKWISHVLDKNVETIKLNSKCQLPDSLFNSSSITNMELYHVEGNTSATVHLSKLKSLLLEDAKVDDALIDRILIGSPVLENLVIRRDSTWISRLNIMSPSVKILKLLNIGGGDAFGIRAPGLQELEISGQFSFTKCEYMDVSSLSKATLTFKTLPSDIDGDITSSRVTEFNYGWGSMATIILKSLSYVGELIIGSQPIQVLSLLKLSGTPSPLFMCKQLTIMIYLFKFDIPGIACLLENAPHLETLLIKVLPFRPEAYTFYQAWILFQDVDPHLSIPYGKFPQLKNVKIEYSQMPCKGNFKNKEGRSFDFELMECILKSTIALEKLVLCSSRGWSCGDNKCLVPNCFFQCVSSLHHKLISTMSENKAGGWELKKCIDKSEFVFSKNASILSTAESSSSSMQSSCAV